jgi:FKBP12-rapamycin complex-associated protein
MIRVLLPKSNDSNPTVAASITMCLGELMNVAGEEGWPYVKPLMADIVKRLQDPSTLKRNAALRALGQMCSSAGYVIDPLVDYPNLLPILGKILDAEPNLPVRREVMKVLGILGALDPYKRMQGGSSHETAVTAINVVKVSNEVPTGSSDDYFQTVVINSLLGLLKEDIHGQHHYAVIEAIMSIFKTQGLKCVAYLPQVNLTIHTPSTALKLWASDNPSICTCRKVIYGPPPGVPSSTTRHSHRNHQAACS